MSSIGYALREVGRGFVRVFVEIADTAPPRSRYTDVGLGVRLPWPMTPLTGRLFIFGFVVVMFGGAALSAWAVAVAFEPSLWRIVAPIAWLLIVRTVVRAVVRRIEPADAAARWAELDDHRRTHPLG
ncbi:hypothetical protein [Microbacterium oleivorans]|uniref:Uncharacterized protein n=1 Tax=Microbacterium oleivorans TaxID=273677 RepID=A0A7D5F3G5_9MICO|nr:hypothetical protein [Microbacterium oleivorans]QLD10447.1 hypothetical protein HW566_00780 [Microbacterium oleivorans]